jgi:hypothetical protein
MSTFFVSPNFQVQLCVKSFTMPWTCKFATLSLRLKLNASFGMVKKENIFVPFYSTLGAALIIMYISMTILCSQA